MAKRTKQVTEASEAQAPEAISFEDFIQSTSIHPGLIASFRYEASQTEGGLDNRPSEEWIKAFEEQSNKTY